MELDNNSRDSRTFWEVLWDAIRGLFVSITYGIIDAVAMLLKQLVYSAVYN